MDVLEQQGRLLARAQRLERTLEQGAELGLLERVAGGGHVERVVLGVGGPPPGGRPQVVVAAVQGDAVQPGSQPHLAVARQPLVGADEHVVGDVLGVLAVVDHAQGEVVDADRVAGRCRRASESGARRRRSASRRSSPGSRPDDGPVPATFADPSLTDLPTCAPVSTFIALS